MKIIENNDGFLSKIEKSFVVVKIAGQSLQNSTPGDASVSFFPF